MGLGEKNYAARLREKGVWIAKKTRKNVSDEGFFEKGKWKKISQCLLWPSF